MCCDHGGVDTGATVLYVQCWQRVTCGLRGRSSPFQALEYARETKLFAVAVTGAVTNFCRLVLTTDICFDIFQS